MGEFIAKFDRKKVEELFSFVADKCNELETNNGEATVLISMLLCASIRGSKFGKNEKFCLSMLDEFMSICKNLLKESGKEFIDDDG